MNNLTIRKAGKYYQIGYYLKGSWVNVEHIGTAERVLSLVRREKPIHTNPSDISIPTDTKPSEG